MKVLLDAHLRILRKLERAGDDGLVASELVPDRVARDFVLKFLYSNGLIDRRRRFRGERIFITSKGLHLLKTFGDGGRI